MTNTGETNVMSRPKDTELPEIMDFLNKSRMLIRQMELLSNTKIPEEYFKVTQKAARKLSESAKRYAEGN